MPDHTPAKKKAKAKRQANAKPPAKKKNEAKVAAKPKPVAKAKTQVASSGGFGKGIKDIRDVKGKPNGKQKRKA